MCDTVLDIMAMARSLSSCTSDSEMECLGRALSCCDRVRALVFGLPRAMTREFHYDDDCFEADGATCVHYQLSCRRHLEAARVRLVGSIRCGPRRRSISPGGSATASAIPSPRSASAGLCVMVSCVLRGSCEAPLTRPLQASYLHKAVAAPRI